MNCLHNVYLIFFHKRLLYFAQIADRQTKKTSISDFKTQNYHISLNNKEYQTLVKLKVIQQSVMDWWNELMQFYYSYLI